MAGTQWSWSAATVPTDCSWTRSGSKLRAALAARGVESDCNKAVAQRSFPNTAQASIPNLFPAATYVHQVTMKLSVQVGATVAIVLLAAVAGSHRAGAATQAAPRVVCGA